MTVGEKIRTLRKRAGLSQTELAKRTNLSKQTIWKYEFGIVKNIPLQNIEAIAKALNDRPDCLVGWE